MRRRNHHRARRRRFALLWQYKLASLLALVVLSTCHPQLSTCLAQGTAFTYQGRLVDGAVVASGTYDLRFAIYDSSGGPTVVAGPLTNSLVAVSNGLFTVTLDFGNQFHGPERWLEMGVRTNGGGAFVTLAPRQPLTPSPYAITAGQLSGLLPLAQLPAAVVTNNAAGLSLSGSFTGHGGGLSNVNAATLNGVSSAGFWRTNGNLNTHPTNGAFLGTIDTTPFEIHVDSRRAFRLEPYGDSPNLIAGSQRNSAGTNLRGITIAGGGDFDAPNRADNDYASVLGGYGNTASGRAATAMGFHSTAQGFSSVAAGADAVASGESALALGNTTAASGNYSTAIGRGTIASGESATAMGWATTAAQLGATALGVATEATGERSTAAGFATVASGFCATALGRATTAAGEYSLAAGQNARALHPGSFVWADASGGDFTSTGFYQFLIRATGGVGLGTSSPQGSLHVYSANNPTVVRIQSTGTPGFGRLEFVSNPQGDLNEWRPAYIQSSDAGGFTGGLSFVVNGTGAANKFGEVETMRIVNRRVGIGTANPVSELQVVGTVTATAFNPPSDRNLKENFSPVDSCEVLAKVVALPISRWHFKGEATTPHVGPMAQDFHAAFGLGTDERHIATVDADGVALAAIQGLNQKLEQRLEQKETEIAELKRTVDELKECMQAMNRKLNGGAK